MAAVVVTLPESRPEDDEDVVWGLSTATALWARGERADAVVWLRRAADAAATAGQEARASELRMFTVRVEQALEQLTLADGVASASPLESRAPDRVSLGFEEIEPEPISAEPPRAVHAPPPVPAAPVLPPVPAAPVLAAPVPVVAAPTAPVAAVPRAAVATMRPKSIRPPAAPVAPPRPASVAPPPSPASVASIASIASVAAPPVAAPSPLAASTSAVFHVPPPPPPSTSGVFHAPAAPIPASTPVATSAPASAAAPALRPPSTPPGPPSRAPEPSAYPSARKATGPRVPILDPWADEPTMPSLRVDPVLHTLQVEGDEVMVQMRRGAARAVEEEDGVITSAAPLDHTLRRQRIATPPARRVTATGEQPPGSIADASTGVVPKAPGAAKPHLPPKLPEKHAADGAPAVHPLAATLSEASKAAPSPPATVEPSQPQAVPPAADPAPPPSPVAVAPASPATIPPVAAPAAPAAPVPPAAISPSGPPSTATMPSFRLDPATRKAAAPAPAAAPAASPIKPKVPTPTISPPRATTVRSMPAVMPRPRPVTIPPPAAAGSARPAAAPADGVPAKSGAPIRFPQPPSRPPPPNVAGTLPNPAATTTVPKRTATTPPAASVRTPPHRSAMPPPPPTAPARPAAAESSKVQPAPQVPATPPPAGPSPAAPSAGAFDASVLESVEALADVPAETRTLLASRARVEVLRADDEVSAFGAALVIEGSASVSATIVDAPVAHASPGTLVPTRGTLADAVALRVVAGARGARVALWDQPALDETLHSCPWVLEELAGRADRLQGLAGATMGPLGEMDEAIRERVLDKLVVCVLRAGEAVDAEGIAAALVGAGSVEIVMAGKPIVVRSGEVLFPRAGTPEDAKAGAHGTILLVGDAGFTADLETGPPSLASLFAPR